VVRHSPGGVTDLSLRVSPSSFHGSFLYSPFHPGLSLGATVRTLLRGFTPPGTSFATETSCVDVHAGAERAGIAGSASRSFLG
ncbi:MAG: hypothetical protein ABIG68_10595, partial [Acidobacteriota bacterium]